MEPGKSEDFKKFYHSFFVDVSDVPVDIADYVATEKLVGEEKQEAERLLIDAIYSAKTHSVFDIGTYVKGLGALHSDTAADFLSQILSQTNGLLRAYIAESIWKTNHSPEAEKVLVDMLRPRAPETFTRLTDYLDEDSGRHHVVYIMREFTDQASQSALLEALDDECPLVRRTAAESLIERYHCSTEERRKNYKKRKKTCFPPQEEADMIEGIYSTNVQTQNVARSRIIERIQPDIIPAQKIPDFTVRFFQENPQYIIYEELDRQYWFHLWQNYLFTKDYLDGPNGTTTPFEDADLFQIVPRVRRFLNGNKLSSHLVEEPHPPEKLANIPIHKKKPFGWRK